jgi:transposase
MSDSEVETRLFRFIGRQEPHERAPVDCAWIHRELRRSDVTLQLLWEEYRVACDPSGKKQRPYGYSQFCDLYARWRRKLSPVMRQVHRAGEKAFVDYSGRKPFIVDPKTGEVRDVELFVMVLGASNYTFVEATETQKLEDFIASHIRAFEYYGVVPHVLVPDQLRSAVQGPHRYDPEINPTYAAMASHYGTAIIPARPRKPRGRVERWRGDRRCEE